ncbi:pilus assembly protein CpaB [Streptomyces sp. Amel2xB2]|uniref:Pilus assembly protein CpaB n=1 Tax=Streptomyces nanshensis TaxID=518642 RepID=A0A1E7KRS0_9ACTN|nr:MULTISPECIES: Flp pilus assembly protein CpaB [Streptomyces]OEV06618.1 pilus assembly protein CpaB [Streptomyces nanshensis]RAJ71627.1 pilus assembly protein CpaB [Streptomyces sp. Amel2xB2]
MNSRQRRGVVLLVVSVLFALAAFGGVLALIRDVESKVGPESTAYKLKRDVAPYKELSEEQFEKVTMPNRWLPGTAVTNIDDVRGKVATNHLRKGSLLQTDMIAERPELEPGQQEIAIMIDAETGVAGKINSGSRVNIFATFEGEQTATGKGKSPNQSKVIVSDAKVIDVGKLTPFKESDDQDRSRLTDRDGVPITFALSTADAQRVAYAESFAEHVRLALVAPGDGNDIPKSDRTYTLNGDD